MRPIVYILGIFLVLSCGEEKAVEQEKPSRLRFEKINLYKYPINDSSKPFQYKITYYFDNGIPHRWLELDSSGNVLTDYFYKYDSSWTHIGAKYKEAGERHYALERVRFENDSTQITEWLDSLGTVYYSMTDNLNKAGKTYRATFKGDQVHGFDSTFYTPEGFVKRIFFTNIKGKVFNDRMFTYDSINPRGDWVIRKKIMSDTIRELQIREVAYDSSFVSKAGIFYPGLLSTGEFTENVFSFTEDESVIFQTRTLDWDHQFASIATKANGLFTESIPLSILDTLYNGAISPSGNKIIYAIKEDGREHLMLLHKTADSWSEPVDLSAKSEIAGGYCYWLTDTDLFLHIPDNEGDIAAAKLVNDSLIITDSLPLLNTPNGTEFSPYVDPQIRFLIFTRYTEGDSSQQGFFVSYNMGTYDIPKWTTPSKLEMLPYGWNAYIINEGRQFLYTDGDDIRSIPVDSLYLEKKNTKV